MKSIALYLLAILLLFSACKKSDTSTTTDPITAKIVGKWTWVKTMNWGRTTTPQTEHYEETITFQSNGLYTKYRNGVLHERGSFSLTTSQANYYIFTMDGNTYPLNLTDVSHLVYGDGYLDGEDYYYEKR